MLSPKDKTNNIAQSLKRGKPLIGWKEWFELSSINLPAIKGKIDTGAKTSSLHAFNISLLEINGVKHVRFGVNPLQNNPNLIKICTAEVTDQRVVSDSSGRKEKRLVIKSVVKVGDISSVIDITLANRSSMTFKMLLGRDAVKQLGLAIDPSKSFLQGKMKPSDVIKKYKHL